MIAIEVKKLGDANKVTVSGTRPLQQGCQKYLSHSQLERMGLTVNINTAMHQFIDEFKNLMSKGSIKQSERSVCILVAGALRVQPAWADWHTVHKFRPNLVH